MLRVSSARRDGALPPDLIRPPYALGTLADLLPAAAASAAGGALGPSHGDPLGLAAALRGARRVAVLLIDGLGERQLRAHPEYAPVLTGLAAPIGTLSAPCPSTTPVSLTTMGTALPPGSHGILGFATDVPGADRTLTHTQWRDDPDPQQWQPNTTVFARAAAAGVQTRAVGPGLFAGSGLTNAAYRGATYTASFSPGDLVAVLHQSMAAASSTLTYGYYADLDLTGHLRGVDSAGWRNQLGIVDRMVEQLLDGLPDDAALIVTADHGMVDVSAGAKIDADAIPELRAGVRSMAGEPRARYVYAVDGAARDVLDQWRGVIGERAWVVSREEAIDSGIFGPVDDSLAARIGDVVALARGDFAVVATERERLPSMLIGLHGSLSDAELAVPVLIATGAALG
ncbi:MAG: type phosphodiesterase/nucleotide pyrophosphatase [Jatrophihabitantaceae bacterium]|nr:type phosphodiesterase/nucleotide pyrophosphatase [Jatrophihabitantaceae bacterium]